MRSDIVVIGITFLVICLLSFGDVKAAPKKPKAARPPRVRAAATDAGLKKRMVNLVKRLGLLEKQVNEQEDTIEGLTEKMNKVPETKGLFSDDEPCPVQVPGFYKANDKKINSCYLLAPSILLVNFTEAESFCQNQSVRAHVASPETEHEFNYLQAKWHNERGISSISRFWIGAQRTEPGVWRWIDTKKKLTYNKWIPTSDHDDDRYACSAVYSNEGFCWADVACWGPHMITCELNLDKN